MNVTIRYFITAVAFVMMSIGVSGQNALRVVPGNEAPMSNWCALTRCCSILPNPTHPRGVIFDTVEINRGEKVTPCSNLTLFEANFMNNITKLSFEIEDATYGVGQKASCSFTIKRGHLHGFSLKILGTSLADRTNVASCTITPTTALSTLPEDEAPEPAAVADEPEDNNVQTWVTENPMIVGGAVGGLIVLCCAMMCVILLRRKKK